MPELRVKLPPAEFINSMKSFMESTKKYAELTNKINKVQQQITQRLAVVRHAQQHHMMSQIVGLMRRMPSVLNKLSNVLFRSIDRLAAMLGSRARFILRGMTLTEDMFSGVSNIIRAAGLARAGPIGLAIYGTYKVIRWIWDKSIRLMEAAQQDRIQAIISGTTIGGLRAFRALGWILDDPRLFAIISRIQAAQSSTEAGVIYGFLGVKQNQDAVQTYFQTLLQAQAFLRQFPGQEVLATETFRLPISQETMFKLKDMPTDKVRKLAEDIVRLQRRLDISTRDQINITEFLLARKALLEAIYVQFQRILVNSGIVDVLTKLSKWMTSVIGKSENKKQSDTKSKHTETQLKSFGTWIEFEASGILKDLTRKFDELNRDLRKYTLSFKKATSYLDSISLITPAKAAEAGHPGRAALARRMATATRSPAPEPAPPPPPHVRRQLAPQPGAPHVARRLGKLPEPPAGPSTRGDPRGLEPYIRAKAREYGIDPDIAMRVARSEGLTSFYGDNNTSFSAFQLHVTPGGRGGAVGDNFRRDTGLDPSDPRNERAMIDYALRHARQHGWSAWMGARANGITGYRGINRNAPLPPARTTPAPAGRAPAAPAAPRAAAPTAPVPSQRGPSGLPARVGAADPGRAAALAGGGGPPALTGAQMSVLDAVAHAEVNKPWTGSQRSGYGETVSNQHFDPNAFPLTHPYESGQFRYFQGRYGPSSASGRYQETLTTYRENVQKYGIPGFSEEAQDQRAYMKASELYQKSGAWRNYPGATGDLTTDVTKFGHDPSWWSTAATPGLHKEWTSVPGGLEPNQKTRDWISSATEQFKANTGTQQQPSPAPTAPTAAAPSGQKTMLFLHGMQSRYGNKSPADIEADARRYAAAHGYKLEVLPNSGDDAKGQLQAARERINKGDIAAVYGFSAGGYNANHLREEFPNLNYTITGAPGVSGNIALPNVRHMDLPGAIADQSSRQAPAADEQQARSGGLISPIPGVTDFGIGRSNVYGAARSGGGRLHSGNDLHGPDGSPAVSMNDGVVLYNGYNQGYDANIVIKGNDGVIRRYAVHGATENLPPGTRVSQGQRIGTIARGHIHYEEIPPTINGRPNPVYQEFERNAASNTFTSTTQQRGTVDPSGPLGSLARVGAPAQQAASTQPTAKVTDARLKRTDPHLPSDYMSPMSFAHLKVDNRSSKDIREEHKGIVVPADHVHTLKTQHISGGGEGASVTDHPGQGASAL